MLTGGEGCVAGFAALYPPYVLCNAAVKLAPNDTREGRAKNRRIEVLVDAYGV